MHYRNGRAATAGDPVVGTVFNNGGQIVAGTLVSVSPGSAGSCSAMVGFLVTAKTDEKTFKQGYVTINSKLIYLNNGFVKVQGTEKHGRDGDVAVTVYVQAYTECKFLMHAEDAFEGSEMILATAEAQVGNGVSDCIDMVDQSIKTHEELKGTSGKGEQFEAGYLQAHGDIKDLIIQAFQLQPGDQPPVDNVHVAEVGSKVVK